LTQEKGIGSRGPNEVLGRRVDMEIGRKACKEMGNRSGGEDQTGKVNGSDGTAETSGTEQG